MTMTTVMMVILYRKLLQGYPFREKRIYTEALTDVVPKYRATIWAALLNIPNNCYKMYDAIDKESPSPVDRQIEVDIPRYESNKPFSRVLY